MESKDIKLQPMISEKSYNAANASNKYTFLVSSEANKIEIAKAIESKYKVKVEDVNVVIKPGKIKRDWKTNRKNRNTDAKKAIVTLKKGDKIDEFLNI